MRAGLRRLFPSPLVGEGGRGERKERLRLYAIDAWEKRGEEREKGLEAAQYVCGKIPTGVRVLIKTFKDKTGKYGRYIAKVYYRENNGWTCLNDMLVKEGHATLEKKYM